MRTLFLPLVFSACLPAADIAVIEEIVAKVNGDIVTRTELARGRRQIEEELRKNKVTGGQFDKEVKDREGLVLRDRIDQLLLVQKGKDLSVNVETEISKQMAEIQKRTGIADPDKFQTYVKEQLGMPFEDYKNEMRNQMLTERVIRQEVGAMVNIPRAQIRKYYDDHKAEFVREARIFLAEIFLSTKDKDANAVAQLEKKAKDLVARTKKGEKFPELARDNSDSQTAQNGGDLGTWKKGELSPDIEALIWDKDRNFVTDPIKRPDGFLILKVLEKHQAGQAGFEDVEQEITGKFYDAAFQPKIREYLTKLRDLAFLEIKPGFLDAGASPGKDTTWKDPAQLKPETISKELVSSRPRRKKLLWTVPIPGTKKIGSVITSRTVTK
ncbi:MAG: peptidylprolyl isomerase [Candidatus Solibacter usitatus]|nr:peptidylprolyl isomerase [Candidatus Solibacter usitatus]